VELKDIKAIIDLMKKNSITEFELEQQDSKIRLKRGLNGGASTVQQDDSISAGPVPLTAPLSAPAVQPAAPQPAATGEIEIKSPMIGTFYRAPSPESVVAIIEAMKVMNEIKSEVKGVITQVLIENGKPVEFGQPLFKVRPS
jgi:acetyl-CoA carboxylase biotin carboxyl carrier protein